MRNNEKVNNSINEMILTSLMIALVFIGGYIIKIPTINGFVQVGDCMVFVSAVILGKRKAFLAGALGMSLVDFAAGYIYWVPFTFVIKGLMAYLAAYYIEKRREKTISVYIVAFILGAISDVVGYFISNAIVGGIVLKVVSGFSASIAYATAHLLGDITGVGIGVLIAIPLVSIFKKIKK